MLKQLTNLLVYVHDMPRSVSFYRDTLGLPLQVESPGWSQFDLGNGAFLGLHPAMGQGTPAAGWVPGFSVDDIKAARQRLIDQGSSISLDFHDIPGGVVLEVRDPDGNPIQLSQMGISCAELGAESVESH
jgi:predicted enzyme related to lactoylglutathione lyase